MSEQTYCEAQGRPPIDWNRRLDTAGTATLTELCLWALEAADSWVTCACGNQCKDIPRSGKGVPLDEELTDFGYEFGHALDQMHDAAVKEDKEKFNEWLATARRTLAAIESRSDEILIEMGVAR